MAKKADEENDFRLRPNRPRSGGKSESRAWSTTLKTILRYAGTSRRSIASINGPARVHENSSISAAPSARYIRRTKRPAKWKAHGRYIARESSGGTVLVRLLTSGVDTTDLPLEPAKELTRWQTEGDPRLWKLIVLPEFGDRLDLDRLTRDLMARMAKDLGTKLEWVAVTHFNTEHPHVHIALRGIREDKTVLDLPATTFVTACEPLRRIYVPGNWDTATNWMRSSQSVALLKNGDSLRSIKQATGRTLLR